MKRLFINSIIVILLFGTAIYLTSCKKEETPPTPPVVITANITGITFLTASSGGTVINDGGAEVIAEGVCWSTSENPTITNTKTEDGAGTGFFTSNLTQLSPDTKFYVRAYAINRAGTGYGTQLSFTTSFAQSSAQSQLPLITVFPGGTRYGAASFSIGTKAYIGIGYDDGDWPHRDFWEWDQTTDVWTRKADFPGKIEGNAVSFSIGTRGYIGTGDNFNTNGYTNEFWEYDPATNGWTQKASLPSIPERGWATGFSIGNKGYIGLGSAWEPGWPVSYYHHDFWEWDQSTNAWTKKADFPGNSVVAAVGFSIGNKGYIGTGGDGFGYCRDFWEWDQTTNAWTKKAEFGGESRGWATGFSIMNKGYIGTGTGIGDNLYSDFWEWDQTSNDWKQAVNFGGKGRTAALGFSIGNKGYVGTGLSGVNPDYAFHDIWEITPR
jgi:hypothetical protein